MKDEWVAHNLELSSTIADFYCGCRKIIRPRTLVFENLWETSNPLVIEDAGYTKSKQTILTKGYLHEESRDVAVMLWERRKAQAKYGSVGFTTYNHFIKNDVEKKSKRASVMGPCIQAVTITLLNKTEYTIDVFYRTTELLKKFPADLVFIRDVLLPPFDFSGLTFKGMTCHFANITIHPMYWVTLIPHIKDPVTELEIIAGKDKYFHDWIVKWTARYTCDEHERGLLKFAQAERVQMAARKYIKPRKMASLNEYLRDVHPGHRNEYVDKDLQTDDNE